MGMHIYLTFIKSCAGTKKLTEKMHEYDEGVVTNCIPKNDSSFE